VEKQSPLRIGKIIGTHGYQGAVRVCSYVESPAFFAPGRTIHIPKADGTAEVVNITWSRLHGKVWRILFEGITDEQAARGRVGCALFVEKTVLPKLEEGTYYWCDLIGLEVYTEAAEFLGRIDAVFPTGSNDVYVVKHQGKNGEKERLIPALASVVKAVDIQAGIMRVSLPEGL